ncbi:hypothetical protein PTTG_26154 [Puccinia triticina 1-1 BBBD Race 1]|uniref:Uncharacterized protein n=2 Tax=Puccinia triticina TaxID=208348 RepID=A0A180GXZ8_PUCT1|nr:hypothetical protein PTTG_26154 [Puccinia triticina 1-1 BBBD Race 1]WAR56010.1 hypothetical protein PtB15_6B754 [Puccinia triticina]
MISLVKKLSILYLIHLTSTVARIGSLSSQDHHIKKRGAALSCFLDTKKELVETLGPINQEKVQQLSDNIIYREQSSCYLLNESSWKGKTFKSCYYDAVATILSEAAKTNTGQAQYLTHFSRKLLEPIKRTEIGTKIFDPLYMSVWHQTQTSGPPSESANVNEYPPVSEITFEKIEEERSFAIPSDIYIKGEPLSRFAGISQNVVALFKEVRGMGEEKLQLDLTHWTSTILRLLVVTLGQEMFDTLEWKNLRGILFGQLISLAYFDKIADRETISGKIAAKELLNEVGWWTSVRNYGAPAHQLEKQDWWSELIDKLKEVQTVNDGK